MEIKARTVVNEKLKIRHEVLDDVKYLVVPVVLVRSQVLNGEFLPADEIKKSVPGWNGRPVVVSHPKDKKGRDTTANSPESVTFYEVGRVFNVTYDAATTKLRGEAWIDIEKMSKNAATRMAYRMLLKSQRLEVSTGYFVNSPDAAVGKHNGMDYSVIQRDILPDHLALLPGEIGACSWTDGAGVRNNVGAHCVRPLARKNKRKRGADMAYAGKLFEELAGTEAYESYGDDDAAWIAGKIEEAIKEETPKDAAAYLNEAIEQIYDYVEYLMAIADLCAEKVIEMGYEPGYLVTHRHRTTAKVVPANRHPRDYSIRGIQMAANRDEGGVPLQIDIFAKRK